MKFLVLLLLVLALAGCQSPRRGGFYQDDGPGGAPPPVEVSRIPDAVPKPEPRSRGGNRPYTVMGRSYVPLSDARGYRERGVASWYGQKFHGRQTSNGETYDMYAMSAAHKTLPLPSYVRVRNLENGRSAIVRVNDRGPFLHNRLIDLSYAAASKLGIAGTGTGLVEVEAVEPGTAQAANEPPAAPERKPLVEVLPPAQAAPAPAGKPKLFVQAGAFAQWDNAETLRTRLERGGVRPIFTQSVLVPLQPGAPAQRIYRVRVGPVANVEAADQVTRTLAGHGVANATIVVE
jgi:rare lipoprotein A